MTMLSFLGLFLVVLFGGIGISAIPMDFYIGYKYRPKKISFERYREEKNSLGEKAQVALSKAKDLQEKWKASNGRPRGPRQRRQYNEFRAV
jgi:LMBR1 domain-containing protein 1